MLLRAQRLKPSLREWEQRYKDDISLSTDDWTRVDWLVDIGRILLWLTHKASQADQTLADVTQQLCILCRHLKLCIQHLQESHAISPSSWKSVLEACLQNALAKAKHYCSKILSEYEDLLQIALLLTPPVQGSKDARWSGLAQILGPDFDVNDFRQEAKRRFYCLYQEYETRLFPRRKQNYASTAESDDQDVISFLSPEKVYFPFLCANYYTNRLLGIFAPRNHRDNMQYLLQSDST